MDKRLAVLKGVLLLLVLGVSTAAFNVLGNLVASVVPPSLVKPHLLAILPTFIALAVLLAFLTTSISSQRISLPSTGGTPTSLHKVSPPHPLNPPTPLRAYRPNRAFVWILVLLAASIAWAKGSLSHSAPISHPPVAMVGPFPPRPSDPEALNLWNYARARALHNQSGDFSAPTAPTSDSTDTSSLSPGCPSSGDPLSGYDACTSDNTQIQQFIGAFARWAVPPAPPAPQDRSVAPLVSVGGGGGFVEAGTFSWRRPKPSVPSYLWLWDNFPNDPSYCLAKCPRLRPGDDVFVAVYNIDDKTTAFLWENLTTGEYMYKTVRTPYRDSSAAAVQVATPASPSTYWKYGSVRFQGATLYGVADDGKIISHPLGWYTVQKSTASDPNGECITFLDGGSYRVAGGETC